MTAIGDMTGQWIGKSTPENGESRVIMVNVEARTPGSAVMVGVEPKFQLRTLSRGSICSEGSTFRGKTWDYHVFDQLADELVPLPTFYKRNKIEVSPPSDAEYSAEFDGQKLAGRWKNSLGEVGRFELWRSFSEAMVGRPPAAPDAIGPLDWEEFKRQVGKFRSRGKVLFRGQHSNKYPLRTALHRSGRNNLFRYLSEDVSRLRHQINAITTHYYQSAGEDLLGLLSLAQHHGFPTPLLDWSESPYVAAFFAFDCLTPRAMWIDENSRPPVRVFAFDLEKWRNIDRPLANSLKDPWPDFQFVHPPAHCNPRYYPQQSMAAFSNIDDIEGFVSAFELQHHEKYLTRIDVRADQREVVEEELRFMGITAATLFPGLEGACKSLRAELF